MSKFQELKQAIKSPPIERLAKVEYQSHLLNMIGVLFSSIFLIYKGYWYVIFAFIFSVGISYSQGMSAYMKYKMLKAMVLENGTVSPDKSPSRKRAKLIIEQIGKWISYVSVAISVYLSCYIINPLKATWYQNIAFAMLILLYHIIIYYFVIYYFAQILEKWRNKK